MKLKGNQIQICPAATEDDIVDNFELLTRVDLNQDTLKDAKELQAFMEAQCKFYPLPYSSEEMIIYYY